ncbi:MAG: type II toxin-antitoxin system VapC family toxin [Pirellulales bacterium]
MASTIGYILDTNILIRLIRNDALGKSIDAAYNLRASLASSMICVVTVGEIRAFARKIGWGKKKLDELQKIVDELVWIDINRSEVIDAYSEIDYYSEKVTKPANPIGQNDMWIAAVARASGATLLTTDKDFDHLHKGNYVHRIWIDPSATTP